VAIQLAQGATSPLYGVTVYRPPPMPFVPHPFSRPGAEAELIRRLHAQEQAVCRVVEANLRTYTRAIERAGIEVVPLVRVGEPGDEVLRVAVELSADVVVIGVPRIRQALALEHTPRAIHTRAPMPLVLVSPSQL
jgi:nucleotide-binding universal stress UspA family protein